MNPGLEALTKLLDFSSKEYDKHIKQIEVVFKDTDINSLSKDDLFIVVRSCFAGIKSDNIDKQKNSLKLLSYIAGFEQVVEMYFVDIIDVYKEQIQNKIPELYPQTYLLIEALEAILEQYSRQQADKGLANEQSAYLQKLAQENMIDLYFWMQDKEAEYEQLEWVHEAEKNTDFGAILSKWTRNKHLLILRKSMEHLQKGILEKIFYDEKYIEKTSPLDPELPIIGRYEPK